MTFKAPKYDVALVWRDFYEPFQIDSPANSGGRNPFGVTSLFIPAKAADVTFIRPKSIVLADTPFYLTLGDRAVFDLRDGESTRLQVASGRQVLGVRCLGGPATKPPKISGFGSKIMSASIERQLHGSLDQQWDAEGLSCTIRIDAAQAIGDLEA